MPKILKRPINDNIAKAVHASKPRSCIYPGICAETKVILNPQTKKPKVNKINPLWLNASLRASLIVYSFSLILEFIFLLFFFIGKRKIPAIIPKIIKYKKVCNVFSQPKADKANFVYNGEKK